MHGIIGITRHISEMMPTLPPNVTQYFPMRCHSCQAFAKGFLLLQRASARDIPDAGELSSLNVETAVPCPESVIPCSERQHANREDAAGSSSDMVTM